MRRAAWPVLVLLGWLLAGPAERAEAQSADTSRAAHLRQMRLEKAARLEHPGPGLTERVIDRAADFVERNQVTIDLPSINVYEIHPVFGGGLAPGAGTTAGLGREWFANEEDRHARVQALGSRNLYYGAEGVLGYERGAWVGYGFTRYWHAPEQEFYGLGPNTPEGQRASYRLNELISGGLFGYSLLPNTLLGAHLSYQRLRPGPGRDEEYPTVRERFAEDLPPGLRADLDYAAAGAYAEVDTRNIAYEKAYGSRFAPTAARLRGLSLDASRGFYLAAEVIPHVLLGGGRYDFTRFNLETQAYLPLRRGLQVLALRQFVSFSQTGGGNVVPFYMMRALGGSRTLRGFGSFRFRDRNLALLNAEFRWMIFPILDMALFADAGHVFPAVEALSLYDLEVSGGLGFRLRTRRRVLARFDLARSREGFTLYIEFGSIL